MLTTSASTIGKNATAVGSLMSGTYYGHVQIRTRILSLIIFIWFQKSTFYFWVLPSSRSLFLTD